MPIDPRMVKWDDAPEIDARLVQWGDEKTRPTMSLSALMAPNVEQARNYSGANAVGGALRGAGSIGATLLRPFESAAQNADRRQAMDDGLANLLGADPGSVAYKTAKLGAEVAGTAGLDRGFLPCCQKSPALHRRCQIFCLPLSLAAWWQMA